MGRTLTLEVPEEIYGPLVRTAQQNQQTPEELALQWLVAAVRQLAEDPLERFIGAIRSDIPDWADRHDHHLGQAQLKEMRGGN